MLHLHNRSKRNVALWFGDSVSNTFSEENTFCLEFCTFRVLSNTFLWVSALEKRHALSQILHFCGAFEHFLRKRTRFVSVSALFLHFQTASQSRQNIHPSESILPPGRIFFSCGSAALPAQGMRAGLRKEIPQTNAVRPLSLERMCFLIRRCSLMRRRDLTPWHF